MSEVVVHHGDCLAILPTLRADSIDAVVTDPPYLLTSIVQRFGSDGAAPAKHGADGRFARLSGGFMGAKWDAPTEAIGVSTFEAWLAGFLAGEGCFRVQKHKDGKYYSCTMSVHLRQDDAPALLALQKRLGGTIRLGEGRENRQGIVSAPDIRWNLQTRDECWRLARILDRAPLFAKKARDYALWRRALQIWTDTPKGNRWHPRDVSEMAALHEQLQQVKRFDSDIDFNFDPFMPPHQAFHYNWAREVFRVLKPGAHLVAFGAPRNYHRMACAIEDAGFEIRDSLMWLFGSGFPKSHDVSKAIDKAAGAERKIVGPRMRSDGRTALEARGGDESRGAGWDRPWRSDPEAVARNGMLTEPATDTAHAWQGWGTALKPAYEPVILARKPLIGTVAANVLAHGTGALNIDGCRVPTDGARPARERRQDEALDASRNTYGAGLNGSRVVADTALGRWPANIIHDGSEEVLRAFPDQQSGGTPRTRNADKFRNTYGAFKGATVERGIGPGEGSAARFFYSAKADADDRLGSKHPTVKPTDLMAWLCRLITPPGGVVLDPFAGSGSTGMACLREGFDAVLIEKEEEYYRDILRRISHVQGVDTPLFSSVASSAPQPAMARPLCGNGDTAKSGS